MIPAWQLADGQLVLKTDLPSNLDYIPYKRKALLV